jgi:hypothetical protein
MRNPMTHDHAVVCRSSLRGLPLALACAVGSLLLVGCDNECRVTFSQGEWDFPVPMLVPPVAGCDLPGPEAPSLCTWVHSTDAFVWATVRVAEPTNDPAVDGPGSDWSWEQCDDPVFPAAKILAEVERSFKGDLSGIVEVRIGERHNTLLSPGLYFGPGGCTEWWGVEPWQGGAMLPGDSVMLALHWVEAHGLAVWSLGLEPLVGVDQDGLVRVGSFYQDCREPPPEGVDGMTLPDLLAAVATCMVDEPSAEALERKEQRQAWLTARPTMFAAATCGLR